MTSVLQARDVSLRFPYAPAPALRDLTLHLERGERVLLLGPSGSGKSSLGLCLNGTIPHGIEADVMGSLQVLGRDPRVTDPADLARRVGLVFQDPQSQFCTLTVEDEIAFGLENLCLLRDEIDRRIGQSLQRVGMAGQRHLRLDRLSGGMAQRVALAASLAMDPELLVLDEASANLDPAGAAGFAALVEQLARDDPGRTFLLVEHRLDPLIRYISRVWVLDRTGRLLHDAPPRALFAREGESLAAAGIWQPAATSLARALARERGERVPCFLTLDEALTWLPHHPWARDAAADWSRPGSGPPSGTTGEPLLHMDRVSYTYAGGTRALAEVSLEVHRGEILAIVGGNGAGKSTLGHLMAGLLRPSRGTVRLRGADGSWVEPSDLTRGCGLVFQNPEHQFVTDRVADEVAFELRLRALDESEIEARCGKLLARLGLADSAAANPFTLSQGQKRRLSVATMLVTERPLLVLDEPTFGQDAGNRRALMAELRRLNREGMTLVLATHDMDLVWALARRVAVMADGRLLAVAPVERVFGSEDLMRRARLEPPARARVAAFLESMGETSPEHLP